MKVKFGFLLSTVQNLVGGTYDPAANFREQPITEWLVKVGDKITENSPVVKFSFDKVDIELLFGQICTAKKGGTVVELNYQVGGEWKYHGLEDLAGGDKMFLPELGWIETDDVISAEPSQKTAEPSPKTEKPAPEPAPTKRVRAAPATRKLAKEAGIDIYTVQGTGMDGRVMKKDVERVISEREKPVEQPRAPEGLILLTPSREWLTIRDNLAGGMDMPIAGGEPKEYDLDELLRLKTQYRDEFQAEFGVPLHLSAPVALAVSRALRIKRFWTFNSYWHVEDEKNSSRDKVALYTSVNIGFSVDFAKEPAIDFEKGAIGGTRLRIATLHKANELI